jgi:hypothetical protein
MQIIVGKESADKLKEKYVVLELETFGEQTAFCVVSADKIALQDLPSIEQFVDLHEKMIDELNKGNTKFVLDSVEYLYDKFGGELNSFYDHLKQKHGTQ